MEEDGFVIVSKDLMVDDDAFSISSSRSSLFLVEDPSVDEVLLNGEKDEEPTHDKVNASEEEKPPPDEDTKPRKEQADGDNFQESELVQAVPKEQPKYVCTSCSLDVAMQADIVWEGYMGANKAAYLFGKVLNTEPAAEPRKQQLSTGLFLLQDVRCRSCSTPLGWSYLKAWSEDQKYKEGTTIIQQSLLDLKEVTEEVSPEHALACQ